MCVAESQEEREHEHGSFSINFHGCGHVASTTHDMHVVTNTRPASALLFCQFSFDKSQPVSQSTAVKINKSYISLCCRGVCVYSINYRSTCIRAGWWKWLALCECLCSVCVVRTPDTFSPLHNRFTFYFFPFSFCVRCVCVCVFVRVYRERFKWLTSVDDHLYSSRYCDALSLLAVYTQRNVIVDTSRYLYTKSYICIFCMVKPTDIMFDEVFLLLRSGMTLALNVPQNENRPFDKPNINCEQLTR